jgi:uncharacterized protein YbjT (DUF2867 family)
MLNNDVEIVEFDFTRPETFENALKEVDRIFLMRPPHLGKPSDLFPFIECIKKHSIKLIAFLSLMGIENNPMPPHYKIEKKIEQLELPYSHIRPGFFMQNISGIHAEEICTKDMIYIPAGKSKTSFIDAHDIGLAVATILHNADQHKNSNYTLTGSEALDYFQVASILSHELGRRIRYAKPSLLNYRNHYIVHRKLDKSYVNVTVALYIMTRLGTAKTITHDYVKLVGKQPTRFEEFVRNNRNRFIRL